MLVQRYHNHPGYYPLVEKTVVYEVNIMQFLMNSMFIIMFLKVMESPDAIVLN